MKLCLHSDEAAGEIEFPEVKHGAVSDAVAQ